MKNLTLASMYVLLGDYYSLIKKKSFLKNVNDNLFSFKNKGKIRLLKEGELTNDIEMNDCGNCIVELEQENLVIQNSKTNGYQFKLILSPKMININGIDSEISTDGKRFPISMYEIDCNILGYSKNNVFLQ